MAIPAPYQHVVWSSNGNNEGTGGNDWLLQLPNATGAGNCMVLKFYVASSATLTSIKGYSDRAGANLVETWSTTPVETITDSGNSVKLVVFVQPNSLGGVLSLEVVFTGKVLGFHPCYQEWYNIATSSPVDGSSAATVSIGSTSGSIASGSFNTTDNGDLILQFIQDDDWQDAGFCGETDGLTTMTEVQSRTIQASLEGTDV